MAENEILPLHFLAPNLYDYQREMKIHFMPSSSAGPISQIIGIVYSLSICITYLK